MKQVCLLCFTTIMVSIFACNNSSDSKNKPGVAAAAAETSVRQLTQINHFLQDSAFAIRIATAQDAAYYTNQGQVAPVFFSGPDSTIRTSLKEEKIATNLAGFYAVECGVATLVKQKGQTTRYWLQQIINRSLDSGSVLLLNRFANATWKTGQPFRGFDRMRRDNFIGASFLSAEEVKKDADQIYTAAKLMFDVLTTDTSGARQNELERIQQLLTSKAFALKIAEQMHAGYYAAQGQPAPAFLSPADDIARVTKSARETNIAINLAGFYALECGVNYITSTQNKRPSDILQAIVNDSISAENKQLLERFANATWKAAQPFRGLDRITRDIFKPFDLLPENEIKKDWDQIRSAAAVVLTALQEDGTKQ